MKNYATPDEIIFIFEKVLEGWKTIQIYNLLKRENKESMITKHLVETIATGNSKIDKKDIKEDKYNYYIELRKKVYDYKKYSKYLKKLVSIGCFTSY
jgi:hypothetical protein